MPRRLIKDSYRGWYGWEARFNSMIRMSIESMTNTEAKNKRERFVHERSQDMLRDDERKFSERTRRELYDLRQELFTIRAYGKAYEKYSYYNTPNARKLHPIAESRDEQQNSRHLPPKLPAIDAQRPNPSETTREEPNVTTAARILNSGDDDSTKSSTKGSLRVTFADDSKEDQPVTSYNRPTAIQTLPSITSVLDKHQDDAAERHAKYEAAKRQELLRRWTRAISNVQNEIRLSRAAEEAAAEAARAAAAAAEIELDTRTEHRKAADKMKTHGVKSKQEIRAGIFPAECRNTFTLRRFINEQADDILKVWTPEVVRRHKVKNILKQVKFPELVDRNRSTSGIFREYHRYKRKHGWADHPNNGPVVKETVNDASFRSLREKYNSMGENDPRHKILFRSEDGPKTSQKSRVAKRRSVTVEG